MPQEQLVEAEVAGIREATEAAGMEWDGSLAWRDKVRGGVLGGGARVCVSLVV